MGAVEWWRRFIAMPDQERAKLLALVLGGIIVGMLYALGGLSLYLRSGFLTPVPAPLEITRLGIEPDQVPSAPDRPFASGSQVTLAPGRADRPPATLYPTLTPDLTKTAMAALPAGASPTAPIVTATPYPTPTGAGTGPGAGTSR